MITFLQAFRTPLDFSQKLDCLLEELTPSAPIPWDKFMRHLAMKSQESPNELPIEKLAGPAHDQLMDKLIALYKTHATRGTATLPNLLHVAFDMVRDAMKSIEGEAYKAEAKPQQLTQKPRSKPQQPDYSGSMQIRPIDEPPRIYTMA